MHIFKQRQLLVIVSQIFFQSGSLLLFSSFLPSFPSSFFPPSIHLSLPRCFFFFSSFSLCLLYSNGDKGRLKGGDWHPYAQEEFKKEGKFIGCFCPQRTTFVIHEL